MGLLPPVILGALLIVAFALSAQQRLALNTHTGPMPARQVAYLMRVYHQSSVSLKGSPTPPPLGPLANPPSNLAGQTFYASCADAKSVVTYLIGETLYRNEAVAAELARQSVAPPELGKNGSGTTIGYGGLDAPYAVPVAGIGLSNGAQIVGTADVTILPANCSVPAGAPALQTQVLP